MILMNDPYTQQTIGPVFRRRRKEMRSLGFSAFRRGISLFSVQI